jgi:transposase-like protein
MTKKRNIHRSTEEWQSILQAYHHSGLTQDAFCKTHHLAPSTFAKWKGQLTESASSSAGTSSFVEVLPPRYGTEAQPEKSKTRFELSLSFPRGFQLHMKMA